MNAPGDKLKRSKLATIESLLDNYLEIAAKEERSTLEVLDYLLDQEVKSKEDRALEFRMRLAAFPMEKRLDDFDVNFQPSLDPAVIPISPCYGSSIMRRTWCFGLRESGRRILPWLSAMRL